MDNIKKRYFRHLKKDEILGDIIQQIEAIFFLRSNKDEKTGLPLAPKQEDIVVLEK